MKKTTIYVISLLLLTLLTVGSTYAYFLTTTNSGNNAITANASKFEVIYVGGSEITGEMNLGVNKESGLNTSADIRISEGSVRASVNLILNITTMTENLSQTGLKWEVYGHQGLTQVYSNNGNFNGLANGDLIHLVDNYILSETNTTFTVYVWLDGEIAGNEVIGGEFNGYISARTESVTGIIDNS